MGLNAGKTKLWIVGSSDQSCTDFLILTSKNQGNRDAKAMRPGFNSTFKKTLIQRRAKGKHMRFQDASLMLKARNPCPVCGAETALAKIDPHPLHANFEIHG
jgi:hypothetical protein